MSNQPDFTAEAAAILDALASAYRRGCSDTIARLMAGISAPTVPPVRPVTLPYFPPRGWTETEDDLVRTEWGKSSPDDIGATVNRTGDAVRLRATKLGLPRLPRFAFMPKARPAKKDAA